MQVRWLGALAPEMAHAEIHLTSGVESRRGRGGAMTSAREQTGRSLILLLLRLSFKDCRQAF